MLQQVVEVGVYFAKNKFIFTVIICVKYDYVLYKFPALKNNTSVKTKTNLELFKHFFMKKV